MADASDTGLKRIPIQLGTFKTLPKETTSVGVKYVGTRGTVTRDVSQRDTTYYEEKYGKVPKGSAYRPGIQYFSDKEWAEVQRQEAGVPTPTGRPSVFTAGSKPGDVYVDTKGNVIQYLGKGEQRRVGVVGKDVAGGTEVKTLGGRLLGVLKREPKVVEVAVGQELPGGARIDVLGQEITSGGVRYVATDKKTIPTTTPTARIKNIVWRNVKTGAERIAGINKPPGKDFVKTTKPLTYKYTKQEDYFKERQRSAVTQLYERHFAGQPGDFDKAFKGTQITPGGRIQKPKPRQSPDVELLSAVGAELYPEFRAVGLRPEKRIAERGLLEPSTEQYAQQFGLTKFEQRSLMQPFQSREEQIETAKDFFAVQKAREHQIIAMKSEEERKDDIKMKEYLSPEAKRQVGAVPFAISVATGTTGLYLLGGGLPTAYEAEQARQRTVEMFAGVPVVSSVMVGTGELVRLGLNLPVSVPTTWEEKGKRLPGYALLMVHGTAGALATRPAQAIPEMIGFGAGLRGIGLVGRGIAGVPKGVGIARGVLGRGVGKVWSGFGKTKIGKTTQAQLGGTRQWLGETRVAQTIEGTQAQLGIFGRGVGKAFKRERTSAGKALEISVDKTYFKVPRGAGGDVTGRLLVKDVAGLEKPAKVPTGKPRIVRIEQVTAQEMAMRQFERGTARVSKLQEAFEFKLKTSKDLGTVARQRVKGIRVFDTPLDIKYFEGKPKIRGVKQLSWQEMAMREFEVARTASEAFKKKGFVTFDKTLGEPVKVPGRPRVQKVTQLTAQEQAMRQVEGLYKIEAGSRRALDNMFKSGEVIFDKRIKTPRIQKIRQPTPQEIAMGKVEAFTKMKAETSKALKDMFETGDVRFGKKAKTPRIQKIYEPTPTEVAMSNFERMIARETRGKKSLEGLEAHGRVLFDEPLFPRRKPRVVRVKEPKKVTMLEYTGKDAVTFPAKRQPFKWLAETKKKPNGLPIETGKGQFQLTKTKTKGKVKPKPKPPIEKELFDTKEPTPSYQIQLYDKPVSSSTFSPMFPGIAKRQPLDYTFKAIQDARALGIQKSELLGKTKTDILGRTLTREAEKELQRTRYDILALTKTKTRTISKTVAQERARQRTRTLEKTMPLQRTQQRTRQRTMQIQRALFFTPQRYKPLDWIIEVPKQRTDEPPPPPRTWLFPKPKPKDKEEEEKKKKKRLAFSVFVRRRGKWLELEKGLPRGLALKAGEKYSLKTLGASFKVEQVGFTQLKDIPYRPKGELFRSYKIVKGRRVPLKDTFIQRRGKRLVTGSERTEIQRARKALKGIGRVRRTFGIEELVTKRKRRRKGR